MSVQCPHCGAVASYGHELGHRSGCPGLEIQYTSTKPDRPQRITGVARTADNDRALLVSFTQPLTNDQLRALHDYLREWET